MKKLLALFIIISAIGTSFAQVQPGYVKSIGRPDAPGKPLEGGLLRAKGAHNHIISAADGTFSLPLPEIKPGEAYSLQQIRKNGYELCEQSTIGRSYAFSDSVPLAITMLSTAQLQADKQRIEENAYRAAEKNYKKQLAALEHSKENNLITIEEYRAQMQALVDGFEKYQNLIDALSDHYARADYDNLDTTEREINLCIEQGELDRADSLLHTIFDPAEFIARNQAKLEQLNTTIDQAQTMLTQANADLAAVLRRQEKDAEYLYHLYTISLARFDNEKARFYIETRAELDTTNYKWQCDAAEYLQKQNRFKESELLYNRALALCKGLVGENQQAYEPDMAIILNNLAVLYVATQRFAESETKYNEVLEIRRRLVEENSELYEYALAELLNNMAILYSKTQRFAESETMYLAAVEIQRRLAEEYPHVFKPSLANVLNSLALLYSETQRFPESEAMYKEALKIRRRLAKDNPLVYEPDLAITLSNLAGLYSETQRFSESERMYKEALKIRRRLANDNPLAHEPDLAISLNNLALSYYKANRLSKSETAYREAVEILRRHADEYPQVYEPNLAHVLNNFAVFYFATQRFFECEMVHKEVLEIRRRLAKENAEVYEPALAETLNNIAILYSKTQRFTESETMYKKTVELLSILKCMSPFWRTF